MREGQRASEFGEEIHSNLWGPSSVESLGGKSYYVSFTDDAKRHTHLYLLRLKSETFEAYKRFEAWVLTKFGVRIKTLCSDHGGEYLSDEFTEHLETNGTTHKLTVHDTPEQNGVAERLNGILITKVRAMLHDSGLPKFLWGEAVRHAVWLKNHTSTKALQGLTPYEALTGNKPDLTDLRIWGCQVWVHDSTGSKLDSRAKEGYWVSMSKARATEFTGQANALLLSNGMSPLLQYLSLYLVIPKPLRLRGRVEILTIRSLRQKPKNTSQKIHPKILQPVPPVPENLLNMLRTFSQAKDRPPEREDSQPVSKHLKCAK
jgi:hypothetical protein